MKLSQLAAPYFSNIFCTTAGYVAGVCIVLALPPSRPQPDPFARVSSFGASTPDDLWRFEAKLKQEGTLTTISIECIPLQEPADADRPANVD